MAPKVHMFRIDRYEEDEWHLDEVTVTEARSAQPEELVRAHLDYTVRIALAKGEPVENYDGRIRIMVWAREEDIYEENGLPTRYPDAMLTWHKPDTTLLDAAVNRAAIEWRRYMDTSGEPGLRDLTRAQYDGAFKTAQAVHEAYHAQTGTRPYRDLGDMIETVSALLPDHR